MPDTPAPSPAHPEHLGKYELRGVLGKGAMGIVYDGWDPGLERRVAIKTARLPPADDAEAQDELARFKREAQAAGRLSHPNIVGVFDFGLTSEIAYFAMELIDGTSLKDHLARDERFGPAETVRVMHELLAGLGYSHARGVIHRDIKPANLMITKSGTVKIADFGIARIESSSMTQAGTVMGTPAYMSPEQFMGQTVDQRTDIYSAGVVLYQMLTGEKPFEGGITAIMHKVLNTVPPRPSELSVTAKPAFDAVVARAMARRPEDRFASAAEFAAAVTAAFEAADALAPEPVGDDATMVSAPRARAEPARAAPSGPPPKKARGPARLVIGGLLVALVVLAAGGTWFGLLRPAPPATPAKTTATPAPVAPPAPAAPPVKEAVAPPQPAPAPKPDPMAVLAAVRTAAGAATCAATEATLGPDGRIAVQGLAVDDHEAALRRQVSDAAGGTPLDWRVQAIPGPHCPPLDFVHAVADAGGASVPAVGLSLRDGPLARDGAPIDPVIAMPPMPAYLRLDYFSNDGTVTHLYPLFGAPQRTAAAGAKLAFDGGKQGWLVGQPFGTDLIVATVSSVPLLAAPRPQAPEPSATYAAALGQAAAAARAAGAQVGAGAIALQTQAK